MYKVTCAAFAICEQNDTETTQTIAAITDTLTMFDFFLSLLYFFVCYTNKESSNSEISIYPLSVF